MSLNDDDYWTNSKAHHYNFDDEDDDYSNNLTISSENISSGSVFNPQIEENNSLPINLIVSEKSLKLLLDDTNTLTQNVAPPVEETIRRLHNGNKFILHMYKPLKDKLLLLDYALKTWDGYIIISVLVFLKQTLKPQLFYYHLTKKRFAIRQFAHYLAVDNKLQELEDLYMATGNISSLEEVHYFSCKGVTNKQQLYRIIDKTSQKINPTSRNKIAQYKNFISWKLENGEDCISLIDQLANIIRRLEEKNSSRFENEITTFKKLFAISDYQYEWTLLNALSSLGMWPKLVQIFIKPNWFTKKAGLKTVIDQSLFVTTVDKHDPPKHIIEEILQCMSDQSEAFCLAERLKCHKYLINYYIGCKDRLALVRYKNKVTTQSEEYFMLENALAASDKRWKN